MERPHVSIGERRARLAVRHRLVVSERTDDIAAIARSVAALHATDPVTVYLSATARMCTPGLDAVADALHERRTLVRHHAMRRTVWVFEPQLARAAHAACTAALAVKEWRTMATMVEQSGIATDGAAWCASAREQALATMRRIAPCTARQLGAADPSLAVKLLLSQDKSYAGTQGAHTRLVQNLGFNGAIVRTKATGSWINGEFVWALADAWIDGGLVDESISARAGAATVAAAYLAAFGPATSTDVQWWAGWTVGMAKQALADIGAESVTVDDVDGEGRITTVDGWVLPDDAAVSVGGEPPAEPWVALLPSLDPTIMGWKQRAWYLGELAVLGGPLFDRNGNAGHSIWANGEVVGTWVQRRTGEIVTYLFRDVSRSVRSAIDSAATDLRGLLGEHRITARYPAPIQSQLLA